MNGDLISRKALLGSMDKRYKEKCSVVQDNLAEGFMQMEKLIKEQPTAYDVDKVVEQLEKRYMEMVDGKRKLSTSDFFEYVVRLIKSGGIE